MTLRRLLLRLWEAAQEARRRLRGRDLALLSGGLTFYAGIAAVPALLVSIRIAAALTSETTVEELGRSMAAALPDALGAPEVARDVVERGAGMSWASVLVAVLPATLYGEGLRRAFTVLTGRRESLPGWRGRIRVLPLVALTPLFVLAVLVVTPVLDRLTRNGVGPTVFGIWLAFVVDWLVVSAALAYVYAVLSPDRMAAGATALGALTTGSFVAGFLQGFVLFLSLPLDLGAPFAGYDVVGGFVAVGLWLWLLHALVLGGHELTRALAAVAPDPAYPRAT